MDGFPTSRKNEFIFARKMITLPQDLIKIIADYVGILGEKYKPMKGFSNQDILWNDPFLTEYMLENNKFKLTYLDAIPVENLPKLRNYVTEDTTYKAFIFPIFYGKENVEQYIKKYNYVLDYSMIDKLQRFGNLYLPLVEYCYENRIGALTLDFDIQYTKKIWELISGKTNNFKLLDTRSDMVSVRELAKNNSPGAAEYLFSRELGYYLNPAKEIQKNYHSAEYFFENRYKIDDHIFILNPHPKVVKYYLNNQNFYLKWHLVRNRNPEAVKYIIENRQKYIIHFNDNILRREISASPAAIPYILNDFSLIYPTIYNNPDVGILYEAHPELFDITRFKRYFHVRDFERERLDIEQFVLNCLSI